jgi:hypothetical protein
MERTQSSLLEGNLRYSSYITYGEETQVDRILILYLYKEFLF